jgi:hypothetical protein
MRYIVKLTEQEELSLRQLAIQPGYEVIFKLLDGEALDAQSNAMECKSLIDQERSMALLKAQDVVEVVSNMKRKLDAYRLPALPVVEEQPDEPLQFLDWTRKEAN